MHDIKWIRNNPDKFDLSLKKRGLQPSAAYIINLDENKRKIIANIQELQQIRNEKIQEISFIMNKDNEDKFLDLKKETNLLKAKIAKLEDDCNAINKDLDNILSSTPNVLDEFVPQGNGEEDNIEIKKWGTITKFDFLPKEHCELGENLSMMDFVQTAKISGSRFVTLKNSLAKLERVLGQFMLDNAVNNFGYVEISPPILVRDNALFGTGQLPKMSEELFETTNNYRLIPTAEVPLTNLVADSILEEHILPKRYTALTPCFRSEAGAAGKDTRGMLRQHQFWKVELVSIVNPINSANEHERMLSAAEDILQKLELPYRVMLLCSKDTGFSSSKTYDLEVWLPGQKKYREISSISNCCDFQARRMRSKYREHNSNNKIFVHSLNGSALAVGRTLIAVMENYQQEDGSILIPKALHSYMNEQKIVKIT